MYVQEETYAVVSAFVLGYDEAYQGGLLAGFAEWLMVKLEKGSNLSWPVLVLHAAFPDVLSPQEEVRASSVSERYAIDVLFRLIAEFDEVRSRPGGLNDVFGAHREWRQSQKLE